MAVVENSNPHSQCGSQEHSEPCSQGYVFNCFDLSVGFTEGPMQRAYLCFATFKISLGGEVATLRIFVKNTERQMSKVADYLLPI